MTVHRYSISDWIDIIGMLLRIRCALSVLSLQLILLSISKQSMVVTLCECTNGNNWCGFNLVYVVIPLKLLE